MRIPRTRKIVATIAALGLVAAACGGDDDSGATPAPETTAAADESTDADDGDADDGDADEPPAPDEDWPTLRITSLALCNEIAVFWAIEKGIFEEFGVDVELVRSTGGSAGLAAVVGGSADLAFANTLSSILAYDQGFPIKYIASLYHVPEPPAPGVNALIVTADSDIQTAQDLVGARIGVNELGGINQLVTQNWLRVNGVDPTDVNFVALPFPELAPAVVAGRIDAAQLSASAALTAGDAVRSIADPYQEGPGTLVFAGYLATDSFHDENQPLLEAFRDALVASVEDFRDDDERFDVMAEYCPPDADSLRAQPETSYFIEVDFELFQRSAEILVEEGQLREMPDIEGLVPEWARL